MITKANEIFVGNKYKLTSKDHTIEVTCLSINEFGNFIFSVTFPDGVFSHEKTRTQTFILQIQDGMIPKKVAYIFDNFVCTGTYYDMEELND